MNARHVAHFTSTEHLGMSVTGHGTRTTAANTRGNLPPWVERGVLVYGPRKAGTTLFQNLLDGGDQVFAYPAELKLKSFIRKPERAEDIEAYYSS